MKNIEFLKKVVSNYSPTGQTDSLVKTLITDCTKFGYKCHKDEAGNFIGEIGSGSTTIMLVGHIDTVPGEINVVEKGGKLYGRGTVDAKGPFATFVMAASSVTDKKIIIVGCCDEEGASNGAKNLLGKYNPDFIVIGEPSSVGAVTLGYKGTTRIYYSNKKKNFHSSSEELNALEEGVMFYNSLIKYCSEFNFEKKNFDQLNVTLEDMNYSNDGLYQNANLKIRFRVPVDFDENEFKNMCKGKDGENFKLSIEEKGIRSGKNNALVRSFLKSIRSQGLDPKFKVKMGTADMNILGHNYKCPILAYGPGDSSLDHTPNEHILIEEYEKAILVLNSVLKNL